MVNEFKAASEPGNDQSVVAIREEIGGLGICFCTTFSEVVAAALGFSRLKTHPLVEKPSPEPTLAHSSFN
jgi:hypothetical protein